MEMHVRLKFEGRVNLGDGERLQVRCTLQFSGEENFLEIFLKIHRVR